MSHGHASTDSTPLIILIGIFPILTGVSIFCLADNHSSVVRNIFGGASNNEGMGLLALCFDWNLITSQYLYAPLWLQINENIGIMLTYVLMAAMYYGNVWRAKDFPFMSQAIFVRFPQPMHIGGKLLTAGHFTQSENGSQYNQTALLTDGKFDPVKYAELGVYSITSACDQYDSRRMTACILFGFKRTLSHCRESITWRYSDSYRALSLERFEAVCTVSKPLEQDTAFDS